MIWRGDTEDAKWVRQAGPSNWEAAMCHFCSSKPSSGHFRRSPFTQGDPSGFKELSCCYVILPLIPKACLKFWKFTKSMMSIFFITALNILILSRVYISKWSAHSRMPESLLLPGRLRQNVAVHPRPASTRDEMFHKERLSFKLLKLLFHCVAYLLQR